LFDFTLNTIGVGVDRFSRGAVKPPAWLHYFTVRVAPPENDDATVVSQSSSQTGVLALHFRVHIACSLRVGRTLHFIVHRPRGRSSGLAMTELFGLFRFEHQLIAVVKVSATAAQEGSGTLGARDPCDALLDEADGLDGGEDVLHKIDTDTHTVLDLVLEKHKQMKHRVLLLCQVAFTERPDRALEPPRLLAAGSTSMYVADA
jgi:hypothetical protein